MTLPKPSGAFEWTQEPWGAALRCIEIPVPHLFSTRGLALGRNGQADAGWSLLAAALGVDAQSLLRPHQVHGAAVTLVASERAGSNAACSTAADIIMTARTDVAVAVQAADCVPLLFCDSRTGAVAAAHAGWRGTAAGAARAVVTHMEKHFATRPDDLIVAVGPSIGPCCYRVGDELLEAFGPAGRRWFYRAGGSLMLNLWSANRDQLLETGVRGEHVHVAELCTAMHPDVFDSYRRDGRGAGRLAAAIRSATLGQNRAR